MHGDLLPLIRVSINEAPARFRMSEKGWAISVEIKRLCSPPWAQTPPIICRTSARPGGGSAGGYIKCLSCERGVAACRKNHHVADMQRLEGEWTPDRRRITPYPGAHWRSGRRKAVE